jgi:hypothetical protein
MRVRQPGRSQGRFCPEANDILAYRQEDLRKTVIAPSAQSQRTLGIKRCEINGAGPAIDDQFGHGQATWV